MAQTPLISVVIPAFNEEDYIERTLISLKNQSFSAYEVIVVDNNSTDKTAQIAEKYNARVIKEHKQGYVYSLNKGMQSVRGNIIAVTDADTKPDKNWLKEIAKALKGKDIAGVAGAMTVETGSGIINLLLSEAFSAFVRINFFLRKPHISGFNFAVKRNYFVKAGGINTSFTMSPDVDLGLRLAELGRVIFVPECLVTISLRRWKNNVFGTFAEYAKGYYSTVWERKPSPIIQKAVR